MAAVSHRKKALEEQRSLHYGWKDNANRDANDADNKIWSGPGEPPIAKIQERMEVAGKRVAKKACAKLLRR